MINLDQEQSKIHIPLNIQNNPCPKTLSLSFVTLPFLVGIATFTHIHHNLIEFGKMSEEIFRGDRLPLLSVEIENKE